MSNKSYIYAWVKGALSLTMPSNTGIKIGGKSKVSYLVLRIHYSHKLPPRHLDCSGISAIVTQKPQRRYVGVFHLVSSHIKSPRENSTINISCKFKINSTLQVFAFRTQAHLAIKTITGYRIRRGKITMVGKGNPQRPDVFYQQMKNYVALSKGDWLFVRCEYEVLMNTTTIAGSSDNDKMCGFYMMYYTTNKNISEHNLNCWGNQLNILPEKLPLGPDDSTPYSNDAGADSIHSVKEQTVKKPIAPEDFHQRETNDMNEDNVDIDEEVGWRNEVDDTEYNVNEVTDEDDGKNRDDIDSENSDKEDSKDTDKYDGGGNVEDKGENNHEDNVDSDDEENNELEDDDDDKDISEGKGENNSVDNNEYDDDDDDDEENNDEDDDDDEGKVENNHEDNVDNDDDDEVENNAEDDDDDVEDKSEDEGENNSVNNNEDDDNDDEDDDVEDKGENNHEDNVDNDDDDEENNEHDDDDIEDKSEDEGENNSVDNNEDEENNDDDDDDEEKGEDEGENNYEDNLDNTDEDDEENNKEVANDKNDAKGEIDNESDNKETDVKKDSKEVTDKIDTNADDSLDNIDKKTEVVKHVGSEKSDEETVGKKDIKKNHTEEVDDGMKNDDSGDVGRHSNNHQLNLITSPIVTSVKESSTDFSTIIVGTSDVFDSDPNISTPITVVTIIVLFLSITFIVCVIELRSRKKHLMRYQDNGSASLYRAYSLEPLPHEKRRLFSIKKFSSKGDPRKQGFEQLNSDESDFGDEIL